MAVDELPWYGIYLKWLVRSPRSWICQETPLPASVKNLKSFDKMFCDGGGWSVDVYRTRAGVT
jgi:hypothetical protein